MASKILVKRGTAAPAAAALTQYELAVDTTNKRTYIGAADGSGILVGFGTATSAEMASIVTDETGSGKLVFGTSPEITTSLTTASASFDLLNTTVRTLNIGGFASTINILGTTDAAALSTYNINIGNAILTPAVGSATKNISIGGDAASPSITNIILGGRNSGGTLITSPGTITVTVFGTLDVSQTAGIFMPSSFNVGQSPLQISGTDVSMASPGESFIRDAFGNGLNIGDNSDGAPIKIGDYADTHGTSTILTIDASLETIYLAAANGTSVDGLLNLNTQAELRFYDSDGSNYVGLKSPATVAANKMWILPSADGTSGQVLSTNGSATLSWATASGGSKTYAVYTPLDNQPPAANYATIDTRNSIMVLDFDAATDEHAVFVGIMPEAASLGSGLKIRINWMATSATSGTCRWGVQIERMNTDEDSDSFHTAATAGSTTNATSGIITTTEITITTIDSVVAGDPFRIKVYRDADGTSGTDDMTGDAELVSVEVRSAA